MTAQAMESPPNMQGVGLAYLRNGWSVIPIQPRSKKPLIDWSTYQKRRPTEEELHDWFERWPNANVGIVTGSVSGLVVLDLDGKQGESAAANLEVTSLPTPMVRTASGAHIYLKHPGSRVANFVRRLPGVDFRGDGGYVVAPPSMHSTGWRYAFAVGRDFDTPLSAVPPQVMSLLAGKGTSEWRAAACNVRQFPSLDTMPKARSAYVRSALEREAGRVAAASEGQRNDTLNSAAFNLGQLVGAGELSGDEVKGLLLRTASACGLLEPEAIRTVESGLAAGLSEPRDMQRVGAVSRGREPCARTFVLSGKREEPASDTGPQSQSGQAPQIVLGDYRLDRLTAGKPPGRKWLVRNAVPLGVPGVLFGAGGIGKSMAALDLCLKIATRSKYGALDPVTFLGPVPVDAAGAAVFITLEDDSAEVHRRVSNLDPDGKRTGAPCFVLPALDLPGFDPAMIRQEGRAVTLTDFATRQLDNLLNLVCEEAGCPVRLLMLDPAGDLIEGDEDSAATVKPLMRRLREVASQHGCTVILLGHVPKGSADRETFAARGMRGSGAWVANARFAIGVYAPEANEKIGLLRRLSIEPTPDNLDRVVYGVFTKANFPGAPAGVLRFLRDPVSGAWVNYSDRARSEAEVEQATGLLVLVDIVRRAAEVGMPFQVTGSAGLYKRRSDLPEPLCRWGQKRLENLGREALEKQMLVKCRATGSNSPCWLDVPDGPYAVGSRVKIEAGSLRDLLAKKRGST